MNQNFLNFINIIFFISIFLIILNPINVLQLLLVTEILWISLYYSSIAASIYFNDVTLVAIGVFILGFSVVDVGIGFIITIIQRQLLNTDMVDSNTNSVDYYYKQLSNILYMPRFVWNKK